MCISNFRLKLMLKRSVLGFRETVDISRVWVAFTNVKQDLPWVASIVLILTLVINGTQIGPKQRAVCEYYINCV